MFTSRTYEDHLNTIANVCCGGLLHVLASLPEDFESVPINALVKYIIFWYSIYNKQQLLVEK